MKLLAFPVALTTLLLCSSASFADDMIAKSPDGDFWLSGGVGLMRIEAHEYVYLNGKRASQLDWETKNVVLYSATVGAEIFGDWTVKGTVNVGANGSGHMVDYDWVPGLAIDDTNDGWSDRSTHPDTRLDHYISGSIELGRDVFADDRSSVGISGGFKYTDIRWNAFGGSYIYSDAATRDDIGEFPDDAKVITYRQKIPVAFLGLDGSTSFDRLTLSGGVKGGLSFGIDDIDDHYGTGTRFFGDMRAAPVLMLNAAVDYRLNDSASLYIAGNFENVFRATGDLSSLDTTTGARETKKNAAGASFETLSIQFGLKGRF
jgi:outer membrane protease